MAPLSPNLTKASPRVPLPKRTPSPAEPTVLAPLPGFSRPPEETLPTAQPPTPTMPADGPPGGGAGLGSPEPAPIPAPPTSRLRGLRGRLRLLSGTADADTKALLADGVAALLATVGSLLQLKFANPKKFGPNDVWTPDASDLRHIADPLASIAARHTPSGLGGDSDVADLLTASIGAGGYAVKNIQRRAELVRHADRGAWSDLESADPAGPFAGDELGATAGTAA